MSLYGATNCLAGCIADYYCSPLNKPGPAGEQAESFSPFVWIKLGDQEIITVGNKSHPSDPHTACIKSYEIGFVDTAEVHVEILDEAGGKFGALVDSAQKCAIKVGKGTIMEQKFGWVYATCEGVKRTIESVVFKHTITKIETNFTEGKVRYKITGNAYDKVDFNSRKDKIFGEENKGMKLEDAITQLCAQEPPIQVQYCWREPDGKWKCGKHSWKGFGEGGPRAAWQSDNQNRIAVISKWLEPFRIDDGSERGKGVILLFDSTVPDKLYVVRDLTPDPGESKTCGGSRSEIGTFIVNGGKCSPVLEFNPTFEFLHGFSKFSVGGGTSGPGSTRSNFAEKVKLKKQEVTHGPDAGLQQQLALTQQAWHTYGPKNAFKEMMTSQQAHMKANALIKLDYSSISADLVILGDPRNQFCDSTATIGRNIAIVAINPFTIRGESNGGCGGWLAEPGCNQVLSNKNWQVQGINHSIKEGSYTTTLKVMLTAGGIEVGVDDPLGGVGSGGVTVKNTC